MTHVRPEKESALRYRQLSIEDSVVKGFICLVQKYGVRICLGHEDETGSARSIDEIQVGVDSSRLSGEMASVGTGPVRDIRPDLTSEAAHFAVLAVNRLAAP